jgi:4-oxalocrotonate tautomerase
MPIINISVTSGRTADQLHDLGTSVHRAVVQSLAVPESSVRVLIEQVEPELWFSGGQTLADKGRAAHGPGDSPAVRPGDQRATP